MTSLCSLGRTALVGAGILCACSLPAAPPAGQRQEKSLKAEKIAARPLPPPLPEACALLPEPPDLYGPPQEAPPAEPVKSAASPKRSADFAASLLPDRAEIVMEAQKLCEAVQKGRLRLTNATRETEQLHCLMSAGAYLWPAAPQPAPVKHTSFSSRKGSASRNATPDKDALQEKNALLLAGPLIPDESPVPPVPTEIASVPSPYLLRMLNALAAHSTAAHPLELMSLLRPPYRTARFQHAGPGNPHSLGLAADIASYEGYRIRQDRPEECVKMTLALLRDLPPGRYRLGMPKSPEIPALVGAPQLPHALIEALNALTPIEAMPPAPSLPLDPIAPGTPPPRRAVLPLAPSFSAEAIQPGAFGAALGLYSGTSGRPWPFFPPPEFEMENGVVAPLLQKGKPVLDGKGLPQPHLIGFRNESYALEEDLSDSRLRDALIAARKRGVDVIALFPDSADHVHVDVKQER